MTHKAELDQLVHSQLFNSIQTIEETIDAQLDNIEFLLDASSVDSKPAKEDLLRLSLTLQEAAHKLD